MYFDVIKSLFTASTTAQPPLKQKGKVSVEETKTPESPKLGHKFTRIPKVKEPEPEVIKLRKGPVKPPEPQKQIVTHKAKVTKHCDPELMVHGLHDREDREIITLGRTEQIFTAEEELIQLGHFEEAERVGVSRKTEKEGWTRSLKPHEEVQEPEVSSVDQKKIIKLPKADKQTESVSEPEKSGKPEEELQKVKLKKVPTEPKRAEKEVVTQKVELTRHYDIELTVEKLRNREDQELITFSKTEQGLTADEEASVLGHKEKPEKLEPGDDKSKWIRTPKALKDDKPDLDLTKKTIEKLPKKEQEQEVVTLKQFEKPQKPETPESPKAKTEAKVKTDSAHTPVSSKRGEKIQRDQATAAMKHRKDEDAPSTGPEVTLDSVNKDQKEIPANKEPPPKSEKPTHAHKLGVAPKIISTPEKEQIVLKPFTKITKPEEKPENAVEKEKKKPAEAKIPSQDQTCKKLKAPQIKQVEKISTPKIEDEKPQDQEEPTVPPRKPSLLEKKEVTPHKEAEKEIPQKQTEVPRKGTELRKTPSRVSKEKAEEELRKPTEQLKKTPSPKVDKTKPKEDKLITTERKPSAEKATIPKPVSPKDSVQAVTLKMVPKKPSPEEVSAPEKPSEVQIPVVKEVSPGAVQMRKVPTQPEEEVLKVEAKEVEGEEEEEAWGWELVPTEDWEGDVVDGALETPGMPGGKRGDSS